MIARKKLAFTVQILYFVVSLLVIVSLALQAMHVFRRTGADVAWRMAELYAVDAATDFQLFIASEMLLVQQLTRSAAVGRWLSMPGDAANSEAARAEIAGFSAATPEIDIYFWIRDTNGALLFDGGEMVTLVDAYPLSTFSQALYDEHDVMLEICDVYPTRMRIGRRVYHGGEWVGVIFVYVPLSGLTDAMFAEYSLEYARGYIVDAAGNIRMYSHVGTEHPTSLDAALSNTRAYLPYDEPMMMRLDRSMYRYASLAPIAGTDWNALVLSNYHDIFSYTHFIPLFIGVAITLALAVFVGHWVTNRTVIKPVNELTVSAGTALEDYAVKIYGTTRMDEIGDLARSIQNLQNIVNDNNETMMTLMVERDRQLSLMATIDEATYALLAIPDGEDEQFNYSLQLGVATVAACVQAGRMDIWKNEMLDNGFGYVRQMTWDSESEHGLSYDNEAQYLYSKTPEWEERFRTGDMVNGPIAEMSEAERDVLGENMQSVLIMPVHMQEHFWGIVSFGDYYEERYFTPEQTNLLRSAVMMIVSAFNRHKQSQAVHEANARTKKLLDSTPVCCCIWNHKGELIACNASALAFFGAEDVDQLRARYLQFLPAEQADGTASTEMKMEYIERAFAEERLTGEWLYRNPETGEGIPTEIIMVRVNYDDGEQVVAEYTIDMRTHMRMVAEIEYRGRQLEEALQAAQSASRAKGDFLANMSHEMRTPMNAIIGMTTIGKNADTIERKDYSFNRIQAASIHLLGVINDVLDMSKIEAGKMELAPQPFEPSRMMWQVNNVISFRLEEKKQNYEMNLDPDIPRMVVGDDQRLIQVLTNLLSNAVKFTPDEKTIRLSAQLISREEDDVVIQFEVRDEGIGISPEQQARLFQSFMQAEASTTRRFGGTGLGLAISKHIVELMGGRIWVESELGKGAAFCFTVRMQAAEAEAEETGADDTDDDGELPDYTGKTLLLAEDIDINQEIVITMLEITNIDIHCCNNGEEALQSFEADPGRYDLIFMDVHMPIMDGHDATRRIRALPCPEAKTVPIVAMTANVFQEDIKKCLDSGMNAHLGKPLDFAEMMATLKKYLA